MKKLTIAALTATALALNAQQTMIFFKCDKTTSQNTIPRSSKYLVRAGDTLRFEMKVSYFRPVYIQPRVYIDNNRQIDYLFDTMQVVSLALEPGKQYGYVRRQIVMTKRIIDEIKKVDRESIPRYSNDTSFSRINFEFFSRYLDTRQLTPFTDTERQYFYALYDSPTLPTDDAVVESGETVVQYIDLNGRATESPKGLVIAVYSDGRRRKVVVD